MAYRRKSSTRKVSRGSRRTVSRPSRGRRTYSKRSSRRGSARPATVRIVLEQPAANAISRPFGVMDQSAVGMLNGNADVKPNNGKSKF